MSEWPTTLLTQDGLAAGDPLSKAQPYIKIWIDSTQQIVSSLDQANGVLGLDSAAKVPDEKLFQSKPLITAISFTGAVITKPSSWNWQRNGAGAYQCSWPDVRDYILVGWTLEATAYLWTDPLSAITGTRSTRVFVHNRSDNTGVDVNFFVAAYRAN